MGTVHAVRMITSDPNNAHLVRVLQEHYPELYGRRTAANSSSPSLSESTQSDTPVSDRLPEVYPSTSNDSSDSDSLLTDAEINRRYQGGFINCAKNI